MTIGIRPARPEEAAAIQALHTRSVRAVNAADYTRQQIDRWLARQDPERVRQRCAAGAMLVAVDNTDVIRGFASVVGEELRGLYVDANHLRQGIGTRLLHAAEGRVATAGHRHVRSVITVTARAFYAHNGYQELRELRWPADDLYGLRAWEVVKDLGDGHADKA